jgi:hypothetical protein
MYAATNYRLKGQSENISKIVVNNLALDIGSIGKVEVSVTSINFQNVIRTLKEDD